MGTLKLEFAFVPNNIRLSPSRPVDLGAGFVFGPATVEEVELIRDQLLTQVGKALTTWPRYDQHCEVTSDSRGRGARWSPAGQEDWRYYVVRAPLAHAGFDDTERLLSLVANGIDISFTVLLFDGGMRGWSPIPAHVLRRFSESSEFASEPTDLPAEALEGIADIRSRLVQCRTKAPFIAGALNTFAALREVPRTSPLKIVGHCSVFEMLLTRRPRSCDDDSVSRQFRHKLCAFVQRSSSHGCWLAEDRQRTKSFWSKIYDYRSRIAHGGQIDFDKELSGLAGYYEIEEYLCSFSRRLIRIALEHPDVISELKHA